MNSLIPWTDVHLLWLVSCRKHHCKCTLKPCQKFHRGRKGTLHLISATMKMTFTLGHHPISDTVLEFSGLMPSIMKHNTNILVDSLIVPDACMHCNGHQGQTQVFDSKCCKDQNLVVRELFTWECGREQTSLYSVPQLAYIHSLEKLILCIVEATT